VANGFADKTLLDYFVSVPDVDAAFEALKTSFA